MPKLCNINLGKCEETYKRLGRLVEKLKGNFSIQEIYLYGSFASREIHEGSDIDLIIVGDFAGNMFARIGEVLKLTDLPVEPLIYTPDEFKRMRKHNPFIRGVLQKGKKLV